MMKWLIEILPKISLVAIGGVLWQLYLYWRGRPFQERLLLDIKTASTIAHENRVLFVEVQLINAGKGKLQARPVTPDDYVYQDKDEQLRYSCSLQVRRVNVEKLKGETFLDWYKCSAVEPVPQIPAELNLLDDYLVPSEDNKTVFWMEPGDVVHLPAVLVLRPGHYLLKVSFYGTNPDEDFWSRLVYVHIE